MEVVDCLTEDELDFLFISIYHEPRATYRRALLGERIDEKG